MHHQTQTPMKTPSHNTDGRELSRRSFIRSTAIAGTSIATFSLNARAQVNKNSRLRIFQIGAGGIAGLEQRELKSHPKVEFAGFCDIDGQTLEKVAAEFPGSWTVKDYREAFANRLGDFDAVIVETPDFHHAPMMLTAMKHNKHVYGQKPLVHQLDELRMMKQALAAKPGLVTQMGNQRASRTGRMQAVEILRKNQLGRPVEAYIWTGGVSRGHYFNDPWVDYPLAQPVPGHIDWNLWRGPLTDDIPYTDEIAPRRWRSFWETGGGQLADWGCHLIDLLYFAYDLPSPEAVQTHTHRPSNKSHTAHNLSTITYPGGGRFTREKFVVHYNDSGLQPSFAALGLPAMKVPANRTMVVCEDGVLLLEANGEITIFRKGKVVKNEPMPEVGQRHHWHDWVDNCFGDKKPLWAPFDIGVRITEPALLSVKATRFPGEELRWDGKSHRFTNHDQANAEIVSRTYREGFAPPKVG